VLPVLNSPATFGVRQGKLLLARTFSDLTHDNHTGMNTDTHSETDALYPVRAAY
jgi:hypothetical protein